MGVRRSLLLVPAMVSALASGGCSFIFSEGPPSNHEQRTYFECGSSYGAPAADVAATALMGGTAASVLSESREEYIERTGSADGQNTSAGVFIGIAAITAGSAVYGFVQTARCRDAKSALGARVQREHDELVKLRERQGPAATPASAPVAPPASPPPPASAAPSAPPPAPPPSAAPAPPTWTPAPATSGGT